MKFFGNRIPEVQEDESLRSRVYQLEKRCEALELGSAERQLAVLNLVEKVMYQLRARDRKRAEENPSEDDPGQEIPTVPFRGDQVRRRGNY